MVFKLTRQIGLLKMNLLSYAQKFSGRAIFFRIATLACYMGFWASDPRVLTATHLLTKIFVWETEDRKGNRKMHCWIIQDLASVSLNTVSQFNA